MESLFFLGLSVPAWITIATMVVMFGLLIFTKLPADMVFMSGMAVLLITGVLPASEALAGFSSVAVVIEGVLYVVIAGLVYSGAIQWMTRNVLGVPSSYPKAIVRLMLPAAALSSFLLNTAVVSLFLNVVKTWARKLNMPPSRLLIPLSYASGMGGVCTLIGTAPNLIISGFYMQDTGEELNIFTTTLPGLFCLTVGILSMLALRRLLPDRKSAEDSFENTSEYTVELLVPSDSPAIGKSVAEAHLLDVKGGRLVEVVRFDKEIICPVPADEFVLGGDRLVYSGHIDEILDLKRTHGLVNATHPVFFVDEADKKRKLRTATVSFGSPLIGECISETSFETEQGMVLVAVARQGERIDGSPRDVRLRLGDTLLLECADHRKIKSDDPIHKMLRFFDSEEIPNIGKKTVVSSLIMIGMVLLSSFGVMPLLNSCFLAALAMVITRCCSIEQARNAIEWNVLMVFAGFICLGTAIEKTGIATELANFILDACGTTNPVVVLAFVCLVATVFTEFISDTAAAAMFYPIAYQTAVAIDANPLTFCIALMIAVSSSFATPIGASTHMLIYGMGGYRFTDFMKIGVWMNLIILAANIFIVTLLFPL